MAKKNNNENQVTNENSDQINKHGQNRISRARVRINQAAVLCTALVAAALMFTRETAFAADVFVRGASGSGLSIKQAEDITSMVKRAVRRMPEHHLVNSEQLADFTLQPSVFNRDDQRMLKIEKTKEGDLISSSEEELSANGPSARTAMAATETAMNTDDLATGNMSPGTVSGSTMSANDEANENDHSRMPANQRSGDTVSGTTESSIPGGDVRSPSPIFHRADRLGAFQVGLGPSFSTGMGSDQALFDLNFAYAMPIDPMFSAKGFGDFNLPTGGNSNRFVNIGVGCDVFPLRSETYAGGQPYLTGDVGYGLTRDKNSNTEDAVAVGAGGGFKFAAQELNMDVNLHYTVLTAQLQNNYPAVLGLRAAVNF